MPASVIYAPSTGRGSRFDHPNDSFSSPDANVYAFGARGDGITDDTAAFVAALASIPAGGGRVFVPLGNFLITAELTISIPGTCLVGSGWNTSVLKKGATNINLIRITASRCRVENLNLDGNSLAQGSLIKLEQSNAIISRNFIHNAGLLTDGVYANPSHGILLDGTAGTIFHNLIEGNRIETNHDDGIACIVNTDFTRIIANRTDNNGGNGIRMSQADRSTIVGHITTSDCQRSGASSGAIIWDNVTGLVISGCIVEGPANSRDGIKGQNSLGASANIQVVGNEVDTGGAGAFGIRFLAGAGGNTTRSVVTANLVTAFPGGSIRFDAGNNDNVVTSNQVNAVAVSNAGTGNSLANNI